MTQEFFGPLPPSDFNRDAMQRWFDQQVVSFQKIITGSLQADNVLSSSNYVPGVSGWMIDGDGNAEFNDVEVRGDIVSGNWDGADPVDLSSVTGSDANATLGFALDSSKGSAHFAGPAFFGKKEANGLNGLNTGVGSTSSSIRWLRGGDVIGDMYATGNNQNDNPRLIIRGPDDASSIISLQKAEGSILANVSIGFHVEIGGRLFLVQNGSAASPALAFTDDPDTGIYRQGENTIGFATDGTLRFRVSTTHLFHPSTGGPALLAGAGNASAPAYGFTNDTDTGVYRSSTNTLDFATGGVRRMGLSQGHGVIFGAGGTSTADEVFRWDGSAKTIAIHDLFPDIGNHEVLRANRGSGSRTTVIGYFSSWEFDPDTGERRKDDIVSLAESPRWNRDWFYKIRPIDFRRLSTGEREFGFLLDEWKATADDMKYLTTKGDRWGGSPHEVAVLAATILEVQDHEARLRALEQRLAA